MPRNTRIDWDADASTFYSDFPPNRTFREVCYALTLKMSAEQISRRMKPQYPEITPGAIYHAVRPFREGAELAPCTKCGKMVPGVKVCSTCVKNNHEGKLSPREKQRLKEHYEQHAASIYASQVPAKAMLNDDYTEG